MDGLHAYSTENESVAFVVGHLLLVNLVCVLDNRLVRVEPGELVEDGIHRKEKFDFVVP